LRSSYEVHAVSCTRGRSTIRINRRAAAARRNLTQIDVEQRTAGGRSRSSRAVPTPVPAGAMCRARGLRRTMSGVHPASEDRVMPHHVYKIIQITGTSTKNSDDAVRVAVHKASETIHNLRWFKVTEIRGDINGSDIGHWQVTLDVGFTLD